MWPNHYGRTNLSEFVVTLHAVRRAQGLSHGGADVRSVATIVTADEHHLVFTRAALLVHVTNLGTPRRAHGDAERAAPSTCVAAEALIGTTWEGCCERPHTRAPAPSLSDSTSPTAEHTSGPCSSATSPSVTVAVALGAAASISAATADVGGFA